VDRGSTHGRRWPIGCVALEVTQRCNLDCTACYLSEHSEAVKDIPLEELFRRIDLIFDHYGPHTNVQVTGGEPTLRNREELVAIVRKVSRKGMRPALVTNGIRAKRECPTGCEGVHGRSRPLGAWYARRCFSPLPQALPHAIRGQIDQSLRLQPARASDSRIVAWV